MNQFSSPFVEAIDEVSPRLSLVAAARLFLRKYGHLGKGGQIMLQATRHHQPDDPARFTSGTGTLPTWWRASDFDCLLPEAEWVLPLLKEVEAHSGMKAVRTRIMTLPPGKVMSYHKDTEIWRYHVPASTNTSCMFIVENTVGNMPVIGGLYRLKTDVLHTALNAHKTLDRTHIVVCIA